MHPLQNGSQDTTRPQKKPLSGVPGWFTESGDNNVPSYPGADWFNNVIGEFLNSLEVMGVEFDPEKDDHIKKIYGFFKEKIEEFNIDLADVKGKANANFNSNAKGFGVSLVDLHYAVMKGRGLADGEVLSGNKGGYDVSVKALAGDNSFVLSSNTSELYDIPLVNGQLIVYVGSDGEYYSTSIERIDGIAPATIFLNSVLEQDIDSGINIFSFMANASHPNVYGYRAIADYALRSLRYDFNIIERPLLDVTNSAVTTINNSNEYGNCGSDSVLAYDSVFPDANSSGLVASTKKLDTGGYIARFTFNTKGNDVRFSWSQNGLSSSLTFNSNQCDIFELPFSVRDAGAITSFFISSQQENAQINFLPSFEILKVKNSIPNLSVGTHVLLGDSWFEQEGIFERITNKLSPANIVNKGLGGNTAAQLFGRFDIDVAPLKPDVVWVMVGTNDYYNSAPPDTFNYYINQLLAKCSLIGAHVIVFDPSSASFETDGLVLGRSRALANKAIYVEDLSKQEEKEVFMVNIPSVTVKAGEVSQIVNVGIYTDKAILKEYYFSGCPSKLITKSNINNPPQEAVELQTGDYVKDETVIEFSGNKFVAVNADNTTGSDDINYFGYFLFEKQ